MNAGCVLFVALVHLVTAQGPPSSHPPPQCRQPPQGVIDPHECCKIPAFFKDEDFLECGFEKLDQSNEPSRKRGPPDCSKQICMMKKYNLLNENESVDYEAVRSFMDRFVENNAQFKDAVSTAKERCIGKALPGPPQSCEHNNMVFCISSTLFTECPLWEPTESCSILKKHMEECKAYFY